MRSDLRSHSLAPLHKYIGRKRSLFISDSLENVAFAMKRMSQSPFNKIGQPHNTDTRQAFNLKTAFSNPIYPFS